MTAMRAAPLLPEKIDGSSYLYISLCDPTPGIDSTRAAVRIIRCASLTTSRGYATFHAASLRSLRSLRRVKRLTHIAPLLQARLYSMNDLLEAPPSRFF